MYVKTKDYPGALVRIQGKQGKRGKDGICNSRCGQKICFINIKEQLDENFKDLVNIKNKEFIEKIQKICSSDEYMDILTQNRFNKPNELLLIEYIKEQFIIMINLLLNNTNSTIVPNKTDGKLFLESENLKLDYLNGLYIIQNSKETKTTILEEFEIQQGWNSQKKIKDYYKASNNIITYS